MLSNRIDFKILGSKVMISFKVIQIEDVTG